MIRQYKIFILILFVAFNWGVREILENFYIFLLYKIIINFLLYVKISGFKIEYKH